MIRTFFLILLLVSAVVVLLLLSVNTDKTQPQPTAKPSPAQTTLMLEENTVGTSSARTVDVKIDTGTNYVTGVQIEMSYDPEVLTNVDIKPGTFFENPVALIKEIDTEDGRISYALAVPPSQSGIYGAGTVAVLTFSENEDLGITKLEFLPKTLVSGEGVAPSVLKSAKGLTLDL